MARRALTPPVFPRRQSRLPRVAVFSPSATRLRLLPPLRPLDTHTAPPTLESPGTLLRGAGLDGLGGRGPNGTSGGGWRAAVPRLPAGLLRQGRREVAAAPRGQTTARPGSPRPGPRGKEPRPEAPRKRPTVGAVGMVARARVEGRVGAGAGRTAGVDERAPAGQIVAAGDTGEVAGLGSAAAGQGDRSSSPTEVGTRPLLPEATVYLVGVGEDEVPSPGVGQGEVEVVSNLGSSTLRIGTG